MTRFVFFGGKGGVGKTTMSSAYGLKCADAGLDTLVVSTDPAHSTSDVFDQQFGDDPRAVEGRDGLWAMEIDPDEEVEAHMQEIKRRMNEQVSAAIVNEIDRQIELAHRRHPAAALAAGVSRRVDRPPRREAQAEHRPLREGGHRRQGGPPEGRDRPAHRTPHRAQGEVRVRRARPPGGRRVLPRPQPRRAVDPRDEPDHRGTVRPGVDRQRPGRQQGHARPGRR